MEHPDGSRSEERNEKTKDEYSDLRRTRTGSIALRIVKEANKSTVPLKEYLKTVAFHEDDTMRKKVREILEKIELLEPEPEPEPETAYDKAVREAREWVEKTQMPVTQINPYYLAYRKAGLHLDRF